ncbi:hypothetical protein AAG906_005604 [Vitis piasezkii]
MTPVERDLYREEKCQYCGMVGHIAKICWWVPKRPTQQDDIPQALATLTLDNTIAETEWTSDTGASNHMTGHPMITGRRKGDLYVLSNSPELYFSHRFKSGSADIWHQCLGHPQQFNKKIKVFHSDGGGEFINFKLSSHFLSTGIIHQVSCPYTPEQTVFSTIPLLTSISNSGSSTNATSQPRDIVLPPLQVELYEQSLNTPPNAIEPNQLGLQSSTHQKGIIKPNPKYALTSTTNSTIILVNLTTYALP